MFKYPCPGTDVRYVLEPEGLELGSISDPEKTAFQRFSDKYQFPDWPGWQALMKAAWRDVLTQVILVAVAAAALQFQPWPSWFPLSDEPGAVVLTAKYMYPRQAEYISTLVSVILSFIPSVVIGLVSKFLIGSFWDCYAAVSAQFLSFPILPNLRACQKASLA